MYSAFDVNNVMRNIMKPNNVVLQFFYCCSSSTAKTQYYQSEREGRWLSWTTLARLSCSVVSAMDTRKYKDAEAREEGPSLGGMRV